MNIRRGLFRLWIVASALYLCLVAAAAIVEINSNLSRLNRVETKENNSIIDIPISCDQARGQGGIDYTSDTGWYQDPTKQPNPFAKYGKCYYISSVFRNLYPEYSSLSNHSLSKLMKGRLGIYPDEYNFQWIVLLSIFAAGIGIPLIVLAIGSALVWAFSGFSHHDASAAG